MTGEHEITSFDGAILGASSIISNQRPVVVFVHGLACSRKFWLPQLEAFAGSHDVIALDLAGHGESTHGQRDWTMANFARDVLSVCDHFAVPAFTLVGHSMGGPVALEVMRAAPDRIVRVIGVDTFTATAFYPRVAEAVIADVAAQLARNYPASLRDMLSAYFVPAANPRHRAWVLAEMSRTLLPVAFGSMEGLLRWDLDSALACIDERIACINATAFLDPAAIERYKRSLEIHRMDGVGHFLNLEDPAKFNRKLASLLAR